MGFIALQAFLELNGREFDASDADVVTHVLTLAAGESTDELFTQWVIQHCLKAASRKRLTPSKPKAS